MIVVVTGTDTEVGKTVATSALAASYLSRGRLVAVVKPAQTGLRPNEPGDVDEVRRLAGEVTTRELARLPDPLSPDTAARLAGVTLPGICEYRDAVLALEADHDVVLVEGAGGVMVRIGEHVTLLDLAELLAAAGSEVSFVVVARAGLGTLNHSALTVDAVTQRGFYVEGLVVGSWPADPGLAEQHNLDDLPSMTGVPLLGRIPAGASSLDPTDFRLSAPTWLPSL